MREDIAIPPKNHCRCRSERDYVAHAVQLCTEFARLVRHACCLAIKGVEQHSGEDKESGDHEFLLVGPRKRFAHGNRNRGKAAGSIAKGEDAWEEGECLLPFFSYRFPASPGRLGCFIHAEGLL